MCTASISRVTNKIAFHIWYLLEGFCHSGFLKRRYNSNEVTHRASTCLLLSQLPLKGLQDVFRDGFSGGLKEEAKGG